MASGYVVGFNQCAIGFGFIVSTISPADTLEVFNLPDSLYHFPTDNNADIYANYMSDFLFPPAYTNKFPISFAYEVVPETEREYVICTDQKIGHYSIAVKAQIKIICSRK